ncbi:MAG: methyltransferase family protein [Lacrimispora sp.]|jgi:ubiquinone/menaquinone biosynthesis C-methylase UbiE|nr:methyltransferase family protein [Lacrimispora sp.]
MKHPNYGNWISKSMMHFLWAVTAIFLALALLFTYLFQVKILAAVTLVLTLLSAILSVYHQVCRHAFSFTGGGVMNCIHKELLNHLSWNGNGTLLDIGCGSGALTIRCAKAFPKAKITGIDYWGAQWNYAREQCEENRRIEQVPPITFLKGDAAALPFQDESFDAAISNFVFHEVMTQPDKRKVVREALRVVKKGGVFAFHDLFEQKKLYGDITELVEELKKEGITEINYLPHTEHMDCIPSYVKAPWLLSGLGILYGVK